VEQALAGAALHFGLGGDEGGLGGVLVARRDGVLDLLDELFNPSREEPAL
jgi:hypothetical protein